MKHPKFKNKWKVYSHAKRNQHGTVELKEFQNYMEFTNTVNEQTLELRHTPFTSAIQKTPQHWEIVIGSQSLTSEQNSLLSKQMREFVSSHDSEAIYNKMVQTRWELARLVEMVQTENFRFEFLRLSLSLKEERVKQTIIRDIEHKYDARRGKIVQSIQNLRTKELAKTVRINTVQATIQSTMDRLKSLMESTEVSSFLALKNQKVEG